MKKQLLAVTSLKEVDHQKQAIAQEIQFCDPPNRGETQINKKDQKEIDTRVDMGSA